MRSFAGFVVSMKAAPHRWMAFWLILFSLPAAAADRERPFLVVFAAASLTDALQEVSDGFTKDSSIPVKFSFAASSTLARQIENGAPADVFFSADLEWMDYLQTRKLVQEPSRHDVLGNKLVLVAPTASGITLHIAPHFQLVEALGAKGRLATGDPDGVPAGRYAKEALTKLGVWDSVSDRLVRAESVRAALAFVDRGEAQLGIVYETDALSDKNVRVIDVFPEDTHLPIVYPITVLTNAKGDAAKFVAYVRSPAAGMIFKRYGFSPLH